MMMLGAHEREANAAVKAQVGEKPNQLVQQKSDQTRDQADAASEKRNQHQPETGWFERALIGGNIDAGNAQTCFVFLGGATGDFSNRWLRF
jgi:hypothetical protein